MKTIAVIFLACSALFADAPVRHSAGVAPDESSKKPSCAPKVKACCGHHKAAKNMLASAEPMPNICPHTGRPNRPNRGARAMKNAGGGPHGPSFPPCSCGCHLSSASCDDAQCPI